MVLQGEAKEAKIDEEGVLRIKGKGMCTPGQWFDQHYSDRGS